MPLPSTHRITISLTSAQHEEVMRIAAVRGTSLSEVVREVLDSFLADKKRVQVINPKTNPRGRSQPREHIADVRSNSRADALIAAHKKNDDQI